MCWREARSTPGGQEGPREVTQRTASNPAWRLKTVLSRCGSALHSPVGKPEETPVYVRLLLSFPAPCKSLCVYHCVCVRARTHLPGGLVLCLWVWSWATACPSGSRGHVDANLHVLGAGLLVL